MSGMLVLGLGNILLGDEGIGIHVIQALEKKHLLKDVEFLDGGTTGFELIRYFNGKSKVIIIDAMKAELDAGTVVQMSPAELFEFEEIPFSAHQTGLTALVKQADKFYPNTELVILGIVIKEYQCFQMELSTPMKRKMADVITSVFRVIDPTVNK